MSYMEAGIPEQTILVIENDTNHAHLIERVLQEDLVQRQIIVLSDGTQMMRYLNQEEEYSTAVRPDLILLDLNLPDQDGEKILTVMKTSPTLRQIPIVILTTSKDEEDIFKCYESQGNCYVVKSNDFDGLCAIVEKIKSFWLGIVTLP